VRAAQVELTIWPGTRSLAPEDISTAKLDLSPLADLDGPNVLVQIVDRDGRVVATSDSLRGATLPVDAPSLAAALAGRRPLSTISAQAAAIAAQRDFRRRLNLGECQDEVGQLAGTVDSLLATVEDTLRTHREFVADTSHELRNPLLAIRTNIELMDRLTD